MIRTPALKTLAKYGLTAEDFETMVANQLGTCRVCENEPSTGRLVIDHFHVKGWKKMPPERRRLYVRGLLCWYCNHAYVGRGITVRKSRNVTDYLEAFEERLKSIT